MSLVAMGADYEINKYENIVPFFYAGSDADEGGFIKKIDVH